MNLPNKLTISRIGLAFLCMFFIFLRNAAFKYAAIAVFLLACLTDFWDGKLAREHNEVTNLGKILDPIADKVLVLGAFLAFVELKLIPAWMVLLIILREFIVTLLRIFARASGRIIAAGRGGKNKTISQMVAIIGILLYLALKDTKALGISDFFADNKVFFERGILALMIVTVVLTLTSGFNYLWRNRQLLK